MFPTPEMIKAGINAQKAHRAGDAFEGEVRDIITAALPLVPGEPVAWMWQTHDGTRTGVTEVRGVMETWVSEDVKVIPLYASPPPPAEVQEPVAVKAKIADENEIGAFEQLLRDAVEPFLDWLEQREAGAHIKEVREGLIGVEDVIPDSHVVLGAHLRADAYEEITVGHFRRLRDAYEGRTSQMVNLRPLLDKALATLENYADPTGYMDEYGEARQADAELHEGLLAQTTVNEIRAALASPPTEPAPQPVSVKEARRHATALRQCSLFAVDVGENIAKAMTDAAEYLSHITVTESVTDWARVVEEALQAAADANATQPGYINAREKRIVSAAISCIRSALSSPVEGGTEKGELIACPCTTFEQDEDCPIGQPSLLCSACDGKGITTIEAVVALAAEMLKIAEQVDELEDPFAAWESIDFLKSQRSKMIEALHSAEIKLVRYMEVHGKDGTYIGGLAAEYEASLAVVRSALQQQGEGK